MTRRAAAVVLASFVMAIPACSELSETPSSVGAIQEEKSDELFAAVQRDLNLAGQYSIFVPDRTRADSSAEVLVQVGSTRERHSFNRTQAGWTWTDLISRTTTREAAPTDHIQGPAGVIAEVKNRLFLTSDWSFEPIELFGNEGPGAGQWSSIFSAIAYAEFAPITGQVIADTTWDISLVKWRLTNVEAGLSRECVPPDTVCSGYFAGPDSAYAKVVELQYRRTASTPVTVTATPATRSIILAETYYWQVASAIGGNTDYSWSYSWQKSIAGGPWVNVGSGSTYAETFSCTQTYTNFQLRVVATRGVSGTSAPVSTTFTNPLECLLTGEIDGPNPIDESGFYSWSITPTGGGGGYTYSWAFEWYENGGWHYPSGNASTTSPIGIDATDGSFMVWVTVTSGSGQVITRSFNVLNRIGCDPLIFCRTP